MPGLVIRGAEVQIPGLRIVNYFDDPALALRVGLTSNDDGRPRADDAPITLIVIHTTKGYPDPQHPSAAQKLAPGGRHAGAGPAAAAFWAGSPLQSGAPLVIDGDGGVSCLADLQRTIGYHAGVVNGRSIGIECWQESDGTIWQATVDAAVLLVDVLTALFGVQRGFPTSSGRYYLGHPLKRLEEGGRDLFGVVGHRDVTDTRGAGDPGDFFFDALRAAGYEGWQYHLSEDRIHWGRRQSKLNADHGAGLTVDGIPGQATMRALEAAGRPMGQWVPRPIDIPLARLLGRPLPAEQPE